MDRTSFLLIPRKMTVLLNLNNPHPAFADILVVCKAQTQKITVLFEQ
jgi:hypothetical protein